MYFRLPLKDALLVEGLCCQALYCSIRLSCQRKVSDPDWLIR